jgi:hypothetical protein
MPCQIYATYQMLLGRSFNKETSRACDPHGGEVKFVNGFNGKV